MDAPGVFFLTLSDDPAQPFRELVHACPESQQLFGISVEQLQHDPQGYILGLVARLLDAVETGHLKPELGHLEQLLSVCGALHAASAGPPLHCVLMRAYKEVYIRHFLRGDPSPQLLRALLQPSVQASLVCTAESCYVLASQAAQESLSDLGHAHTPHQGSRSRRGRASSSASSAPQRDDHYVSLHGRGATLLDSMFEQLMMVCLLAQFRPSPLSRARAPPNLDLAITLLQGFSYHLACSISEAVPFPGVCPPDRAAASLASLYNPYKLSDALLLPRLLEQQLLLVAVHFGSCRDQQDVQSSGYDAAQRIWWAALPIARVSSQEASNKHQQPQQQQQQTGKNSKGKTTQRASARGQAGGGCKEAADAQAFERIRLAWLGVLDKAVWACHVLHWRKRDVFHLHVYGDGTPILADDVLCLSLHTLPIQLPKSACSPRLDLQTSVVSIAYTAAESEKPGDTWAVCSHLSNLTNLLHSLCALLNLYMARLRGVTSSQGCQACTNLAQRVSHGKHSQPHGKHSQPHGKHSQPHEGGSNNSSTSTTTTTTTTTTSSSSSPASQKSDMRHAFVLFMSSKCLLIKLQKPSDPQAGRSHDEAANTALKALKRLHFVQRAMLAEVLVEFVLLSNTHWDLLNLLPHHDALHMLVEMLQALCDVLTPPPGYKPAQVEDPTVRYYAASTCLAFEGSDPMYTAINIIRIFCHTLHDYAMAQKPLAEAARAPCPTLAPLHFCFSMVGNFQALYLKYWLEGLPQGDAAYATEVAQCAFELLTFCGPFLEHDHPLPPHQMELAKQSPWFELRQEKVQQMYFISVSYSLWTLSSLLIPLLKASLALARASEHGTNTPATQDMVNEISVLLQADGALDCLYLVHITMAIVKRFACIPAHWLVGLEELVNVFKERSSFVAPESMCSSRMLHAAKSQFAERLQSWATSLSKTADEICGPIPRGPASPFVLQQQFVSTYAERTQMQLRALKDTLNPLWKSELLTRMADDGVLPTLCANVACETAHFPTPEVKRICCECGLIFCEKCMGSASYRDHLEVCHQTPSGSGHGSHNYNDTH